MINGTHLGMLSFNFFNFYPKGGRFLFSQLMRLSHGGALAVIVFTGKSLEDL